MKNRKKTIVLIILLGCLLPAMASGMMAVGDNGTIAPLPQSTVIRAQQSTIFLLSWSDNFLQTSKGTLSTIGVKIIDHADIDRKGLPRLKKLPIVKFVTKDNQVTQVDIYPPR